MNTREKELFLLFKEFMKEVEEIEFFIFQKIKNSKEFKNDISKLEDRNLPKLFSDEKLKVQSIYERIKNEI
ncbi:hypothetical protein AJ935_09015 [Campylobacter sp. BCW_6876]|nr:hypothetical protein [Campylobacter jejuni]EDF9110089.1 hypothetical protein [Campylobacter jejuni]OEW12969.1 hypothetical protein AJ935_09015 [Campylobacter sp. BCW_6876]OEW20095.1 hypothetical protein AJ939_07595 [Campylobacter sp. BCW_6889]